jgi:hypothetical protein
MAKPKATKKRKATKKSKSRKSPKAKRKTEAVEELVVEEPQEVEEPGQEPAEEELLVTLASEEELESPAEEAEAEPPAPKPIPAQWSLPEEFLTVALREGWDDRMEKAKAGRMGAALAASMLLELTLAGRLRLHLDRFDVTGEPTGDEALDAFAQEVQALSEHRAVDSFEHLAKKSTKHLAPWRNRLAERGIVHVDRRLWLGFLPRVRTNVADPEAKARLENRLQRTLVGGTPDVRTILLLGLIESAGLLSEIIPLGAMAFNRKRIKSLLAGRDSLGYRVDPGIQELQGPLIETLLGQVRILTGTRF